MFSWLRLLSSNWVSASSFLLQCGACVQDLMYSHVAGEIYLLSYGKSSSDMKGAHTFFKERGKQSIDCLLHLYDSPDCSVAISEGNC